MSEATRRWAPDGTVMEKAGSVRDGGSYEAIMLLEPAAPFSRTSSSLSAVTALKALLRTIESLGRREPANKRPAEAGPSVAGAGFEPATSGL